MTTKQIAEAVGKTERSIRNWISRLAEKSSVVYEKSSVSSPMTPANYDLDETLAIIEIGMGKNAAAMYRMNASTTPAKQAPDSLLTEKDLRLISSLTAGIVSQIMENMDKRVQKIETRIEQRQALLPAPQIKPRDRVNMIVRSYCSESGTPHQDAWRELYRQFSYRTNTNPRECAKNRNMSIIDYIEAEGMLDVLEAIALDTMAEGMTYKTFCR